ncbi:murein hydrolase activator EnvC family protein [Lacrimispora saccharolytica]|uniref:murein hydrolase activator EnvC family protein n=1 Tax=Lacrimispora saccharolytica TaxID=84030 RepID=UPI00265D0346|nr:M23 family metallopeptidase [Lacrimispora saccharolytica]MCI7557297.1 peptidoglycan DD-metalloendopeptidase family protein [Lachnospiraceae bacterium]MDD7547859.1 peptidoglycan DD-metalloendopeptidase family protein [Lachnospiraceae bacterium]
MRRIGCIATILMTLALSMAVILLPKLEVHAEEVDVDAIKASIQEKQEQIEEAEKAKSKIKSNITNIQAMVSALEKEKGDLEAYVTKLDEDLTDVQEKIAELKDLISEKETEIEETEEELEEAEEIQATQYENMKKRIKFIYEKGDTFYLELVMSSASFGEMLNKATYVEKISEYDATKLEEYKQTCEYIQACKEQLDAEKELLDEAKAQVEEEEANLETLISAKEGEINIKTADINNKEAAIKEYEEDLAAQTATIQALEAAVAAERAQLAEAGEAIVYDGGMFKWPAPSYTRISDDYGNRTHPILGVQQFHNGVDMAAPGGSPILAAYDGKVVAAAYNASMGNYIMINHGGGLYTIYMHASALYVSTGETVTRGQKIAAVGTTGRSTGNHLHFSVRKDGAYVSPWNYLSK